jgi:hypothetical protein
LTETEPKIVSQRREQRAIYQKNDLAERQVSGNSGAIVVTETHRAEKTSRIHALRMKIEYDRWVSLNIAVGN